MRKTEDTPEPVPHGVLLAGGRSSRFGTRKAVTAFRGKALISHVGEAFQTAFASAPVTVLADALDVYEPLGFTVQLDRYSFYGPARALHAAAPDLTGDWLMALPCDTPFIAPGLLQLLWENRGGSDAAVCADEHGIQPLPLLVKRQALLALAPPPESLKEIVAKISSAKVLELAQWLKIDTDRLSFRSANTPQALTELQNIS